MECDNNSWPSDNMNECNKKNWLPIWCICKCIFAWWCFGVIVRQMNCLAIKYVCRCMCVYAGKKPFMVKTKWDLYYIWHLIITLYTNANTLHCIHSTRWPIQIDMIIATVAVTQVNAFTFTLIHIYVCTAIVCNFRFWTLSETFVQNEQLLHFFLILLVYFPPNENKCIRFGRYVCFRQNFFLILRKHFGRGNTMELRRRQQLGINDIYDKASQRQTFATKSLQLAYWSCSSQHFWFVLTSIIQNEFHTVNFVVIWKVAFRNLNDHS